MDFYLYLHVSEGVPVRKKDEILDEGRNVLEKPIEGSRSKMYVRESAVLELSLL